MRVMSCTSPYSSRLSRQSSCSRRDNGLCCCCATCSAGLPPRRPFCSIRRSHRPIARSNALGPHLGSSSRRASPTWRHPCQCQTISSGRCSTAMSAPGRMPTLMGLSRCCEMTRLSACHHGRTGIAGERPSGSCWSGFGGHGLTALALPHLSCCLPRRMGNQPSLSIVATPRETNGAPIRSRY